MHRTVTYCAGRLCLRSYNQSCIFDINSCRQPLCIRIYSPKAARSYATSTKFDLPSLDKKWQKIWEEQAYAKERCGGIHSKNAVAIEAASNTEALKAGTLRSSAPDTNSAGQDALHEERDGGTVGEKMYILPMFPYPSGNLHLGHFRNYTIPDVLARFRRMQGYNILLPMGWDAFGLPAENAAIERGVDPAVWTKGNISKMKLQLRAMNGSWDWSRVRSFLAVKSKLWLMFELQELTTCDPKYYKHTQHLFLLLHQHGLAYQAKSLVNYDPVDKTVLANEQVDANGYSWRSGAKVEKKLLRQWFLKISAFRDALLEDLDMLAQNGNWPERVLSMQRNWLGKSKGARIKFQVMVYDSSKHKAIEVFTTRPDTLFGVQYIALAATHPLVVEQLENDAQLQSFLENMTTLPPDSKDGFLLSNVRAINPLAFDPSTPDATKASLPIYVAPYVLADYGDGAVMGVPGHDLRDNAFWKQNRGEDPIRIVVKPAAAIDEPSTQDPFVHEGVLTSQSGRFGGKTSDKAAVEIIELLRPNELGEFAETWRMRDWLISRQRYWGTPIPIIHCESCGPVPVPIDHLPVELPRVERHWLRGKAGNPLEDAHEWINTPCPKCHSPAKRDTDTMDTFVDSSWYFMRFADPHNEDVPFSADVGNELLPVDLYIGGVEHAILHLLYARFISKFLATTSLWPAGASNDIRGEPFKQLMTQGMVHGKTYTDPSTGRFLKPEEVSLDAASKPVIIATGETANVSFEKMSKSKYNGVDPTTCIEKYGADATRAHMLFQAPVSEVLEWDESKISGVTRWMTKLHDFVSRSPSLTTSKTPKSYFTARLSTVNSFDKSESLEWDKEIDLWLCVQRTIISVTESLSTASSLNTVISDLMSLSNTILNSDACNPILRYHSFSALLRMMAPITPAFAEECWSILHSTSSSRTSGFSSIFSEPFPTPDSTLALLKRTTQMCAVQVNGKLRFAIEIPVPPKSLSGIELEKWVMERVLETEEGRGRLLASGTGSGGVVDVREAKKVIVVRGGRTVNFVV